MRFAANIRRSNTVDEENTGNRKPNLQKHEISAVLNGVNFSASYLNTEALFMSILITRELEGHRKIFMENL